MMSEGNGNNKWQGLPGLTNLRSSLVVPVTTRAYGTNRDKVFCMNQLGGVGRFSNMFASTADGVKLPCQGLGGNIPTNNLGLKLIQTPDWDNLSDAAVQSAFTNFMPTISNNNQLWIDDFDTTISWSLQSQVFNIYNTLSDNQTFLNYLANAKSEEGDLFFPIGETNGSDSNVLDIFPNTNVTTSSHVSGFSSVLSLVYFGSKLRSQVPGLCDQNGFYNGTPVSAPTGVPTAPTSVPTSGSSVGLIATSTSDPRRFKEGTYVILPGST
jgi:hypothetical protein